MDTHESGHEGDHVQIKPFNIKTNPQLIPPLIKCYQNVFASKPWSEWKKCPNCGNGKRWGIEEKNLLESNKYVCDSCGTEVVDYWPVSEVEENLLLEIKENASAYLAFNNNEVIGFCWGYEIAIKDLEKDLEIDFSQQLTEHFGSQLNVIYQSEMGIEKIFRGKKIASELFQKRHEDFLKFSADVTTIRARKFPEPSITYLWFTQKYNYIPVAEYPGSDGRVILAQKLDEISKIIKNKTR